MRSPPPAKLPWSKTGKDGAHRVSVELKAMESAADLMLITLLCAPLAGRPFITYGAQ